VAIDEWDREDDLRRKRDRVVRRIHELQNDREWHEGMDMERLYESRGRRRQG